MKNNGSNLTTIVGLILLVILIFLSAYFQIPALEAFLIVLTLLCLIAFLWSRYSLKKISISIKESEIYAFPGQTERIHMSLQNQKFFPLIWLLIHLSGNNPQIFGSQEDGIDENLTWLMPYQTVSWEKQVTTVCRGVCRFQNAEMQSGDGFGLSSTKAIVPIKTALQIIVYPQIIPVQVSILLQHLKELEEDADGMYTDKTLIRFTRPINATDSYKDINWRSLAKGSDEQVNVYEQLAMKRLCFLPDLKSYVYYEEVIQNSEKKIVAKVHNDEMEHMLSMIASLILKLNEKHILCSLLLPSIGNFPAQCIVPEDSSLQVQELLTALAKISYHCEDTSIKSLPIGENLHKLGQIYLYSYDDKHTTLFLPEEYGCKQIVRMAGDTLLGNHTSILLESDLEL